MNAEKIFYKAENRIKVDIPYSGESSSLIQQIAGRKWSRTLNCWHIPYTKEAFRQLKSLFPEVVYEKKKLETWEDQAITNNVAGSACKDVTFHITEKRIILKLPKNERDIQLIRTLLYSRWDKNQFCWIIPNYKQNGEILKEYFKDRIREITYEQAKPIVAPIKRSQSDLLVIKTSSRSLRIIFGYHKALTHEIKKFPYCKWDTENKWWTIPYAEKFIGELKVLAESYQLAFVLEEETHNAGKSRKSIYDIPNYKTCPDEMTDKLKELRYSESTIRTYKALFEEFINFYHKTDIGKIDEKMIIAFLRYLVTERKVSSSYQNQSINAIKFYYERVLGGQRKVYYIDRPRREKTLPTVLSEEEIIQILNAVGNLKHKAILMTIYSAGLRISEAVNLKIKDIDSQRMQIRVEQSKGKKDRYTLLAAKTLEILRMYVKEYKPKNWLFEGQNREQYSDRSINAILKMAVDKTNIKKHVTVHTLRHSFATHLLENGTDLRYIQNLLGHENPQTTEIYTHVTTKGFSQIKSPMDKLNIL